MVGGTEITIIKYVQFYLKYQHHSACHHPTQCLECLRVRETVATQPKTHNSTTADLRSGLNMYLLRLEECIKVPEGALHIHVSRHLCEPHLQEYLTELRTHLQEWMEIATFRRLTWKIIKG